MTIDMSRFYLVIRHGSNAANQSMCQRAVLGIVEADNKTEARELAESKWTVYNNQHLEILTADESTDEDWNAAQETVDAIYGE